MPTTSTTTGESRLNSTPVEPGFYALGLPPDHPPTLSSASQTILAESNHIYCPTNKSSDSCRSRQLLDRLDSKIPDPELLELPMQSDRETLRTVYREQTRTIAARVREDQIITMVTVGDPLIYSTTGYMLDEITEMLPDDRIRVIPAPASFQIAASRLTKPLLSQNETCAVIPATGNLNQLDTYLQLHDALVLIKIYNQFDRIYESLREQGLLSQAHLFELLGTPEEFDAPLTQLSPDRDLPYMSLILVYPDRN